MLRRSAASNWSLVSPGQKYIEDLSMSGKLFEHTVDVILEDVNLFDSVSSASKKLNDARASLQEAELDLRREVDVLNNRLALEIRRHNPSLGITMGRDGNCVVGYRSYNNRLRLCADAGSQQFACGESAFERRFRRYHGHTLTSDVSVLGEAIANFFKQNYRSIT